MDRGEFIKGGYSVFAADGGSWVIHRRATSPPPEYTQRAFTNWQDLMKFLHEEHSFDPRSSAKIEQLLREGNALAPKVAGDDYSARIG